MCARTAMARWWGCVWVLMVAGAGLAYGQPAETLHVYGTEGPSPAMREAVMAFEDAYGAKVEMVSGTVPQWGAAAREDADAIFCSAGYMMTDLIRAGELGIVPDSVRALYLRPSAILVRPGNPMGVHDFPDLLKPGMRLMVVAGSGQTALWEDMAGRRGDIRTVRAFRENVVHFAQSCEEAQKAWKERDDIDAWITWNIWYLPLHSHADLVTVSDEYVIYRQCNVALTERGVDKPLANRFVEFLASRDGAEIFRSWDWITEPIETTPVAMRNVVAVVCCIDQDASEDGVARGLLGLRRLVSEYQAAGVSDNQLRVVAVVYDDAAHLMLNDAAYSRHEHRDTPNPNKAIIEELAKIGVRVEICAATMRAHGWSQNDLLPGVQLASEGYPRIVDLQLQGYAYLRL